MSEKGMKCIVCEKVFKGKPSLQAHDWFYYSMDIETLLRESKIDRKSHFTELLIFINTLINEAGGVVYIHCEDTLLPFLDEQLEDEFMKLVPDDSLFSDNFERHEIDNMHVAFRVKPRPRPHKEFSTLDFHTKVSLNKGLTDPTQAQMLQLAKTCEVKKSQNSTAPNENCPKFIYKEEVDSFYESATKQAKVVHSEDFEKESGSNKATQLLSYCWKTLRLGDYITAFSKQASGGSFFIGLREKKKYSMDDLQWIRKENLEGWEHLFETDKVVWVEKKTNEEQVKEMVHIARVNDVPKKEYRTGTFECEGVKLNQEDVSLLMERLTTDLKEKLLWYPNTHQEPVELQFHKVHPSLKKDDNKNDNKISNIEIKCAHAYSNDLYVIEVKIKHFKGICCVDPGPKAYRFKYPSRPNPKECNALSFEEWIKLLSDT